MILVLLRMLLEINKLWIQMTMKKINQMKIQEDYWEIKFNCQIMKQL
jgi:hypothetical protein